MKKGIKHLTGKIQQAKFPLTEKNHPATLASEKQIHSLLVNEIIYTGFSNPIA